jgi:hypothetical protein
LLGIGGHAGAPSDGADMDVLKEDQPGLFVTRGYRGDGSVRSWCRFRILPSPLRELPKLRRRTLASLAAFLAAQPSSEVVHAGRWQVWKRSKINGARRAATRTGDLKPRITAIDRLVDSRRGIDRLESETELGARALDPILNPGKETE